MLDRKNITNTILDIPRQHVFDYASYHGVKSFDHKGFADQIDRTEPDEGFVVGALDLSQTLVRILTPGTKATARINKIAAQKGIEVQEFDDLRVAGLKAQEQGSTELAKLKKLGPQAIRDALHKEVLRRHPEREAEIGPKITSLTDDQAFTYLERYLIA